MSYDPPLPLTGMELPDLTTDQEWEAGVVKNYFTLIETRFGVVKGVTDTLQAGDTEWASYTPDWLAVDSNPALGNGTLAARWRKSGSKAVEIHIALTWGSTTTGGVGAWSFSLPSGMTTPNFGEQGIYAKTFTAGASWAGAGVIDPSGSTIRPYMPSSQSDVRLQRVRNTTNPATAGTGIPQIAGVFTYLPGSNFILQGVIEIA